MPFAPGDIIDSYALVEIVGQGGQGAVWKAAERTSGALVALKLVTLSRDDRSNERVRREARALARLSHPSLLRCKALFEDPRRAVLGVVLDWIDGATLASARKQPGFSEHHGRAALTHVAHALAHLHAAGVIHRDVKLANVVVHDRFLAAPGDPSTIKLADLGIATTVGNPDALTDTGVHIGTLPYMAPELIDPRRWPSPLARPAQDVFALGVLGWLLLRGDHPTGLDGGFSTVDLARVYEDHRETPRAWLPASERDDAPMRMVKACLRLAASERPVDAGAALGMLG